MPHPISAAGVALAATLALAGSSTLAHPVKSSADDKVPPAFDVLAGTATTDGRLTTFAMEVRGTAGASRPTATGKLPGAGVDAYVWPTSLDPAAAGFAAKSGILALAITAHPDFDDTPLFDENGDGDPGNDGANWHSHWVVLAEDKACAGGLKVRDISPGQEALPKTEPGLPLALDSPGMSPLLKGGMVSITVPVSASENAKFDAVTARLTVHGEGKVPLLCVTGVYKVGSGNHSLPGRVTKR